MPGTQRKLYRGGIEKAGKDRRIKEGRIGEGDVLCSNEMMSWNLWMQMKNVRF